MILDFKDLSPKERYHLMTQTIIPRPIAWVLTAWNISDQSTYNLAPFSYFTPISSKPPLVLFSVGQKTTKEPKDTLKNAQHTEKLVIHIPSITDIEDVSNSAKELAHNTSEVTDLNLELTDFEGFELPRLQNCKLAFGCSLYEIKTLQDVPQQLVIAQIEKIFIEDTVLQATSDNKRLVVDALKVNPLTRLGGNEYSNLNEITSFKRV